MSALSLRDVTLGYDGAPVVEGLTGRVAPGALLAVVGPNGAGKSSLMKALMGQLKPRAGQIEIGVPRARLAYLPQAAEIDLAFPITVYDFVAMGLWREIGPFGGVDARGREAIARALSDVGLEGFEARPIAALSGGQRQRMLFARLSLRSADLILLDEPFAAVDARTVEDLLALIARWSAQGAAIVAVLHDLALVRERFPETLLLARRAVAWGPTDIVLTDRNLAYASGMVEARDRPVQAKAAS